MGSRQNYVVVVTGNHESVAQSLDSVAPLFEQLVGELGSVRVLDYRTGETETYEPLKPLSSMVPVLREGEIGHVYSVAPSGGSLRYEFEGRFGLVVLSLAVHQPVLDIVRKLWGSLEATALAVVAGEECELTDSEIVSLIESQDVEVLPVQCEAAIVGCTDDASTIDDKLRGGVLTYR